MSHFRLPICSSTDTSQEPELCFSNGDLLVYLRHPGQSSRGPTFRVHTQSLRNRGFEKLLEQCATRPVLHASGACVLSTCPGCSKHASLTELYIPAPPSSSIDDVFDHHITTRNFFAWLYDRPLAGRALGVSLLNLKERIIQYRSTRSETQTNQEIIAYAESQKYLDFRECIDHALAALLLAENLEQQDLWVDAFAHAVGMSHREIAASPEYNSLSTTTRALIHEARLELDVRLARASMSIETFFGDDLSGNFLGLSLAAKDHFDRFRSFLHGYYIEKYGFWPPAGFGTDSSRYAIYSSIYSDFRNLYHHLVDPDISSDAGDHFETMGGICTLQNVQAFDAKHGFETLQRPLPQLPQEPTFSSRTPQLSRRRSWNPITQKKMDRETRKALRVQALIDASNRDMAIMECPLIRRYSRFESKSVADDLETVSWIDGRKVRWILTYAILQTLISIMAAPKLVRNTQGLSYPLCCHVPKKMPWAGKEKEQSKAQDTPKEITPDIDYRHSNSSESNLAGRASRVTDRKDRRQTMPTRAASALRASSVPRAASLKKLFNRRQGTADEPPVPTLPSNSFCEILVHGYGNGLNEVLAKKQEATTIPTPEQMKRRNSLVPNVEPDGDLFSRNKSQKMPHTGTDDVPGLSPSSSTSVSRETSNASTGSSKSKTTTESDMSIVTPVDNKSMTHLIDIFRNASIDLKADEDHLYRTVDGVPGTIHINTKTWDEILG